MTQPERSVVDGRVTSWSRVFNVTAIVTALVIGVGVLKPAAPDGIVLLTGPEGGAYLEMGETLAGTLAELGLEVETRTTTGGIENAETLRAGAENTIAFAPATIELALDPDESSHKLVSLGSIEFEPLWIFTRTELGAESIAELDGARLVLGPTDTVVHTTARNLLEVNGLAGRVEIVDLDDPSPETSADAVVTGAADAAFFSGVPTAPVILDLLAHPDIEVLSVKRGDAYEARYPGVAKIVIPEGVADFERNLPERDLELLAVTTNLITNGELYEGVVPLLLRGVRDSIGGRRFTTSQMAFPSTDHTSLPIDRAAQRWYDKGETGIASIVPYRAVRWLNHLGFVVLPLIAGVVVLLKIVPVGIKVWTAIRYTGMLKELEAVEKAHAAGADTIGLVDRLDALDRKTVSWRIPRSKVHDYIDIRQFLHDMRERIDGTDADRDAP